LYYRPCKPSETNAISNIHNLSNFYQSFVAQRVSNNNLSNENNNNLAINNNNNDIENDINDYDTDNSSDFENDFEDLINLNEDDMISDEDVDLSEFDRKLHSKCDLHILNLEGKFLFISLLFWYDFVILFLSIIITRFIYNFYIET
jgi:hypothetical protein